MSYSNRTITIGVVGVLAALFVYWLIPMSEPCPNGYEVCCRILPESRRAGIQFTSGGDGLGELGVNGGVDRSERPTKDQLDAYLKCVLPLAKEKGDKIKLTNIVRIPQEPIGQVRDRWAREKDGPKLQWARSDDPELSLLRIGDDVGIKADVIRDWCLENSLCIGCEPADLNPDTTFVTVSLKPGAKDKLVRKEMPSQTGAPWAVPPKGPDGKSMADPWQDIDDNGTRYYRECQPHQ